MRNNFSILVFICSFYCGVAQLNAQVNLEVDGVIRLKTDNENDLPKEGDIRWNESIKDFQGYIDGEWCSLTLKPNRAFVDCSDTLILNGIKIHIEGITGDNADNLNQECCYDNIDNDGDGLVDCDDPDCLPIIECNCNDGIDNDGDGFIDCLDFDCAFIECDCNDGIDNDGDGLIDCIDPDCPTPIMTECDCNDGIDNDGDTFTDCADFDCQTIFECNCSDGIDNDGDGFIDCDDPDCGC